MSLYSLHDDHIISGMIMINIGGGGEEMGLLLFQLQLPLFQSIR
jgi:hypothetical protein